MQELRELRALIEQGRYPEALVLLLPSIWLP
jgi:hypothetical protein